MTSSFISQRLIQAIDFAITIHGGMKRKQENLPYLVHPISVFGLLARWGADEDTCIAGLLHDAIEDVKTDEERKSCRAMIEERFGTSVLQIVEGVTEQDKTLPWKTRKELYLAHLGEASQSSLLVSCADRTHNTFSLVQGYKVQGENLWNHFKAPKNETLWFAEQVLSILKERLDARYTKELEGYVAELRQIVRT